MKSLICEGRCNPGIALYDEATERSGQDIGDRWRHLARQFRYTVHFQSTNGLYACAACGHARRFGHD